MRHRRTRTLVGRAVVVYLLAFGAVARADEEPPAAPEADAASSPPDAAAAARLADAEQRFKSGVAHFKKREFELALVQFLRSQALHPTWRASSNAAACLRNLKRLEEALDMFELVLRDFAASMPEKGKAAVQRYVIELRKVTGTIDVTDAETGSTLLLDGRRRGDFPALGLINVAPGSHVVRVYKDGFEPFEKSLDVKPGQSVHVDASMTALLRSGVLRVKERRSMKLDVIVDGFVVGRTPWVGTLAVGEHGVMLGGDANFGTLPIKVSVSDNKTHEIELTASDLGASVRVVPKPGDASVAVNDIFVGRGVFEGRLPVGASAVKIAADGYITQTKKLDLKAGSSETITIELARDPSSSKWERASKIAFELVAGIPLARTLGGDVGRTCKDPCGRGVGSGSYGALLAGYEHGNGIGAGIQGGYLTIQQTTKRRPSTLSAVGRTTPGTGTLDDTVEIGGFVAGAYGSYTINEKYAARIRLGAGAVFGSITDTRKGTFGLTKSPALTYGVGPLSESTSATMIFVNPEVRAGYRTKSGIELSAGFSGTLLVVPEPARWDDNHAVNASSDGYGRLPPDALTGPLIFAFMPSIGARYDF